jgi:succinyl-diaminopimelate desuccinylase
MGELNALKIARKLIMCPSITPDDAGVIDLLIETLQPLGFDCQKLVFGKVTNLYAKLKINDKNFCFAGHTDVVPAGENWKNAPFLARVIDNKLFGRGAVDMKTAIACFIEAVSRYLANNKPQFSISLLISGDEEGDAIDGTLKVLEWMKDNNEKIDDCLVGEPTNSNIIGDTIKIGRRGSISFKIEVKGIQGHVAYPHLAYNPIDVMLNILSELTKITLDKGNEDFQPSNLEITNIEVGNNASNVIPFSAKAYINIRFNNNHSFTSLRHIIEEICQKYSNNYNIETAENAEPFLCGKSRLSEVVVKSITDVMHIVPDLSTEGGTSDARFIKDFANVVEFGLSNKMAHKVDEYVTLEDIDALTNIYTKVLENYASNI